MHFSFSVVNDILIRLLCLGTLLFSCHGGHAANVDDKASGQLPDLHAADDAAPGHFNLDDQSVKLGYDSRRQKWQATLDEYTRATPSLTLDYGRLLTNNFGVGASLIHQSGYSEILLNGIYAPRKDLRVRFAGSQLSTSGEDWLGAGSGAGAIWQNGYLVDVKRYVNQGSLVSDIGLAVYTVGASDANYADLSALADAEALDAEDLDASRPALGRLAGYAVNLGVRPMPRSRIDLRRETTSLTYYFDGAAAGSEHLVSNRIKYSHYLRNCTRLQSSYSTGAESDRVGLGIARNRWNLNLSRTLADGSSDTSVQVAYALPLGRSASGPRDCGSRLEHGPTFESIVDSSTERPDQFPREPLILPTD